MRYDGETAGTFLREWSLSEPGLVLKAAKALKEGRSKEALMLWGRPSGCMFVAALLLKSACDSGMTSLWTDVPSMIDYRFQREGPNPSAVDALVLAIGREPFHKLGSTVLQQALDARRNVFKFTVLLSSTTPERLSDRYPEVSVLENFSPVEVAPR